MSKILIGPAGTGGSSEEGFKLIKKSGLDAVEIEFTYSVWMKKEDAVEINKLNKELKLVLSIHAPYFINLASKEKAKLNASKKRILQSCERASFLGASPVVFHAGYYQGRGAEEVYAIVKDAVLELQEEIKARKWKVELAPETTGKPSQFAGLDELLRFKKETGCSICVDFAHLYARSQGKIDYNNILKKIRSLPHIHCHFSGITYSTKGERAHILLKKEFFMPLAKAIKKYKPTSMVIINESPDIFGDAVKMMNWFSLK